MWVPETLNAAEMQAAYRDLQRNHTIVDVTHRDSDGAGQAGDNSGKIQQLLASQSGLSETTARYLVRAGGYSLAVSQAVGRGWAWNNAYCAGRAGMVEFPPRWIQQFRTSESGETSRENQVFLKHETSKTITYEIVVFCFRYFSCRCQLPGERPPDRTVNTTGRKILVPFGPASWDAADFESRERNFAAHAHEGVLVRSPKHRLTVEDALDLAV